MAVADPGTILFVTALATAIGGLVVAGLAYQGYRRNASHAMFYLGIGILLITVSPFLTSYGVAIVLDLPEAVTLLAILGANILGLLSILYSLEGT